MRKFFLLVWIFGIAACSGRGCGSSERIVVKYRGAAVLTPHAPLNLDGKDIGYIDEVLPGEGLQRVIVRLPKAEVIHAKDRFYAVPFTRGTGFRVESYGGAALKDSDEIEADSAYSKKAAYAAMGNAPGGITLPSGIHVPYPSALTREDDREARYQERMGKEFSNRLKFSKSRPSKLDPGVKQQVEALQTQLDGKGPAEAAEIMRTDGKVLMDSLLEKSEVAQRAGNRAEAREMERLANRLEMMTDRSEKIAKREGERAKHPRRPRRELPDFQ